MVRELRLHDRLGRPLVALALALTCLAWAPGARADDLARTYLGNARALCRAGEYFRCARYAFAAIERDPGLKPEGYSWVALGLSRAHMYNAASYFFIKTLQSGDRDAIRRVLTQTEDLLEAVGPDLLRKYLIRHTRYEDYDLRNRSAYLYALGKDALLAHSEERAIGYLNGIERDSPLWPFGLQLRASAYAIHGDLSRAIDDFQLCVDNAGRVTRGLEPDTYRYRQAVNDADDLENRCRAGLARTYYEQGSFEQADIAYDHIEKASLVWPDTLFEQGWNAYARRQFNRTLGKLVSYKSPALAFVFNPEIDVLRAQSYLMLCLYSDANDVINEFNGRYTGIGERVKRFVEGNSSDLGEFYRVGKDSLGRSLYSTDDMDPMLNRFVRGPYFTSLVHAEREISSELQGASRFGWMTGGRNARSDPGGGFPGFLRQVLGWRLKTVRILGGMFVKNSLIDYHSQLISDFERMSYIKLEMLKRAKDQLVYKNVKGYRPDGERSWGDVKPERMDYQYYWSFNGEFWDDELGDYVFGLESQCGGGSG